MTNIDRRNFIKLIGIGSTGIALLGLPAIATACSSDNDKKVSSKADLAALRVSSDIYLSDEKQRLAFSIFNDKQKIVSEGEIDVVVTSPSNKKTTFKNVAVNEKGIKGQGIYSIMPILDEVGNWNLSTNFDTQPLELVFYVNITNTAPALKSLCPTGATPTDSKPLDATILCTRFEGPCGLHAKSVPELLDTKKPFVVIFATPARCQTTYCGPVLELTREVANDNDIPVVHIEIYKNETTAETLDAVNTWGLESEPWIFGIKGDGTIDSRLDGAFDKGEVENLFKRLA